VGFVFQHYALFRHMSVFDNIAFGLQVKPRAERPGKAEISRRVHALLQLVQLDWLADRFPSQLSGGQRQRIALARALAVEPRVLLLDEPFGALDAQVRKELRRWLRRLHDELKVTSIFVTHDQEEALEVSDRIVLMHQGQVVQQGTPQAVYQYPVSPFVYSFLGNVNRFDGVADRGRLHLRQADLPKADGSTKSSNCFIDAPDHVAVRDTPASAYVRPHDMEIERYSPGSPGIAARLNRAWMTGGAARLELEQDDQPGLIEAELPLARFQQLQLRQGEMLLLRPRQARVFLQPAAPRPAPEIHS
jgi:sulfate transport system ATP-binding protein